MLLSKSLLLGRSTNRLGECCAHQKVAHQLIFGINPLRSLNTSLAFTSSPSVTTPTSKTTTNITTTTTATATANVTKSTQNEKEGKHLITVNSALFIDQLHGTIRPTIFDSSHHIYHNDVESIRYACEMASNHFLFRSGKSHTKEYQKIFTPLVVKRLYKDYLKEINRIPRPMERAQAKLVRKRPK